MAVDKSGEEKVRVLRILEYVGTRSWVEMTLSRGSIPTNGTHEFSSTDSIRSAMLGTFPEIMDKEGER